MPLFATKTQSQRKNMTEDELFQELYTQQNAEMVAQTVTQRQQPPAQPDVARPVQQQKSYSSMSKDEQKAEEEKYKEVKAANTFVSSQDLKTPYMQHVLQKKVSVDGEDITQEQLYQKVKDGDCSSMEKLDAVLRNRAATEYFREHRIIGTPKEFVADLKKKKDPVAAMMNPLLRMSISLVLNSPHVSDAVKDKYRQIDELLNTEIMIATVTKKVAPTEGFSDKEMQKNVRSQIFIVKTLLSCHLGKFKKVDSAKTPPETDWPGNVANAFAHCSRVVFTMPGQTGEFNQETETKMINSFTGKAGFFGRMSATHALHRKRRDQSADAKEAKIKFFNPFRQYGMNVAVGGMGNNGIPAGDHGATARKLKNDGSCGHLYMNMQKGDATKNTGMLLGFESDAFATRNQMGHKHDIFATGEFASSFGGQRCDEIGDKYGGRVADLSGVDIEAYTKAMEYCDTAMENLLTGKFQDHGELGEIADMVTGKLMDKDDMEIFFTNLISIAQFGTAATGNPVTLAHELAAKFRPGQ